jgi:hypothetical protein
LKVESVLSQMGKAESRSYEVLQLLVDNGNIFLNCSVKDARRLWSATLLKAPLIVSARNQHLEDLRQFLLNPPTPPIDSESADGPGDESESNELDLPEEVEQEPSKSSSSASQPGRSSRHTHHDEQQKLLDRAIRFGIKLSSKDMEKFSPKQREQYDAFVLSQQQALKSLGRQKRTFSHSNALVRGAEAFSPASPSVHWKSSIPSINFDRSAATKSRRESKMPRVGSKRKPTSSMDESSSHRNSQSSGESSISPSDSSESSSSSSESGHTGGSSSSTSSSSPSHSSDSDSSSDSRRHRRSSRRSRRSKRRRRPAHRSHSSAAEAPSRGLRRFLEQQGIATNKVLMTPELLRAMNGQTPVQWWRNIATAHSASADSRSINEGLHLCMCLLAGDNVSYVRELICRRLLGLLFVVSASRSGRDDAWTYASTLLPLNPTSSVSLPVQQMIEKQARRSRRSSSSTQSYQSHFSRYPRGSRGRGRGGRFGQSGRDGYYSGGDRSDNGGSASSQNNRGTGRNRGRGRGNHQSGAASAPAHRGNSAGGSGAADQ